MEIQEFLKEVTALPGLPGYESAVADCVGRYISPFADEIYTDALGTLIARRGSAGPRVLICAHQDEIGMIVSKIEKDGSLRLTRMGGVDPRILPAQDVLVYTQDGPIPGVIGAVPPHITTDKDREKATDWPDVYVDTGLDAENVRKKVHVGDLVTFVSPLRTLSGGMISGKTIDNRAGVASMLVCAEIIHRLNTPGTVFFAATSEEEVGMRGAKAAAFSVNPDFGIAIDVTHGEQNGMDKFKAIPLEKPAIGIGPNTHPVLTKRLRKCADENGVGYSPKILPGGSGTDAVAMQVTRAGIPTVLISIPIRYMHTPVETASVKCIREAGRLMAEFIDETCRDWRNIEWY